MSEAQDHGVRLGLLGPWRRWRDWSARDRLGVAFTWLVGGVFAGVGWFLLSHLFGDDEGVGSAVFFGVVMVVVTMYTPELTRVWRKMNEDS